MSSSNCCLLTCLQISQEAGQVVWFSHLFKNFPVCCDPHIQRLWCSQWSRSRCFSGTLAFLMSLWMLAIWSLVPLPFLNPAWTSGRSQFMYCFFLFVFFCFFFSHVLLKPGLENFQHYFASMWDECNCAVVWTFFGIAFLWDWNENCSFPVLWPLLSFPNLLAYWVQHFHSIIFQDLLKSSTGIPSPPLALFAVMLSKAHLTSHSRMSGSRWVIIPSWLYGL